MDNSNQNVPIPKAMEMAVEHLRSGRLGQAEAIFQKVLAAEPANPDALHMLGVAALHRGNFTAAANLIQQAVRLNAFSPPYHTNLGFTFYRMKRMDEAVAAYRRAIALKPDYAEAHNNLGIALRAQEKRDDAVACYQNAIAMKPEYAEAHYNLGSVLREQGKYEEAIAFYRKAIELRPDYSDALNNLAVALHQDERFDEAIEAYKRCIELRPDYAEAYNNLGAVHLSRQEFDEAVENFRRAIELKPDYAEALNNLGFALDNRHEREEAARCLRRAIALKPDYTEAYVNLGNTLREMGKIDEAIGTFGQLASRYPEMARPHNLIGNILQQKGDFEAARAELQEAIRLEPEFAAAYRNLISCGKFGEDDRQVLEKIELFMKKTDLKEEDRGEFHFALGKINNDIGLYDKAFPHFIKANEIVKKRYTFDHDEHRHIISRTIESWSKDFLETKSVLGSDSELPVIICGMMRSGTTLTEQIIASHPKAFGAGELGFWEERERKIKEDPAILFSDEMVRACSAEYLEHLQGFSLTAERITDKMPGNFLRLGLIHAAFPKAKIIHCRRNPIDICLSIYFIKFAGYHPYAYDLDDLAFFYREYERLMAHWRAVLPPEIFLEVDYEDVVNEQEGMSRKIVDFCGLEWDEDCLEFHKHERSVKTASLWQVRQPIYKTSAERWKKYDSFAGPLKCLLKS